MTRLPACTPRDVIRVLEHAGFSRIRRRARGSHRYYINREREGSTVVSVPYHARDIKAGTLRSILRQANISPDEFLELL